VSAARLSVSSLVEYDPLRDKSYQQTRLGRSVVDFLAWKELGGAAERTLEQYERDLARACIMFPEKGLREFGDEDMLQVARTFKPRERRTRVAAYRSFFKWALRSRKIRLNPCDALPEMKPMKKKVHDVFTDAEITSLCALPVRDGALMTVMFETGARNGDCRKLKLRDWKQDASPEAPYGLIVFREGKGGKDRQVPVLEKLAVKLAELATVDGVEPADYLWYTRPGGGRNISRANPIGASLFNDWWRRCLTEAEVRYRNPHVSRHTFATRFLRNRGRLETLQLILGHEGIQTTSDLYGHLDMRDVARDLGLVKEPT
jgi:integrase